MYYKRSASRFRRNSCKISDQHTVQIYDHTSPSIPSYVHSFKLKLADFRCQIPCPRPSSSLSWPVLIEGDNILAQKSRTTSLASPIFFPRSVVGEIISSTSCRCRDKNSTRLHHAHSNDYEIKYIPIGITTWRFFAVVGSKIQEKLHMDRAKQVVFGRVGHFP